MKNTAVRQTWRHSYLLVIIIFDVTVINNQDSCLLRHVRHGTCSNLESTHCDVIVHSVPHAAWSTALMNSHTIMCRVIKWEIRAAVTLKHLKVYHIWLACDLLSRRQGRASWRCASDVSQAHGWDALHTAPSLLSRVYCYRLPLPWGFECKVTPESWTSDSGKYCLTFEKICSFQGY